VESTCKKQKSGEDHARAVCFFSPKFFYVREKSESQNFLLDFTGSRSYISTRLFSLSFDQHENYPEKDIDLNQLPFHEPDCNSERMRILTTDVSRSIIGGQSTSYSS